MKRNILGPVVMCLLIIGLTGSGFIPTAQAKTHKAEATVAASEDTKASKKAPEKTQAVVKAKKGSSPEKAGHVSAGKSKGKQKDGHTSLSGHTEKPDHKKDAGSGKVAKHKDKAAKKKVALHKEKTNQEKAALHNNNNKNNKVSKNKAARSKVALDEKKSAKGKVAHTEKRVAHKKGAKVSKAKEKNRRSLARTQEARRASKPEKAVSEQVSPAPEYSIETPRPSDLYLARQSPDAVNSLGCDVEPEQPLSLTDRVIRLAQRCLGIPYRPGGTTTQGFDCSGFVRYVFRENGIELGRSSRQQALEGKPVELSDIRPGDLIFFQMDQRRKNPGRIDHVGLYLGNGQFIHAASSSRSREIKMDRLEAGHFLTKIVGARRILDDEDEAETLTN